MTTFVIPANAEIYCHYSGKLAYLELEIDSIYALNSDEMRLGSTSPDQVPDPL